MEHMEIQLFKDDRRILFCFDEFERLTTKVIDGSLKGWLAVLEKLMQQDVACIIPGHGPPGYSWPEVAQAHLDYLNKLLNETRKAIAKGMFMEEAVDTIGLDEKDKWKLFDQHHKANVSKAFVELEWE